MQQTPLAGLSILIVEDDVLLRKQIASYMEKLGADVTSAGALEAARNLAAGLSFDFVLLDVNLPDGQGTSLLKDGVFSGKTGAIVMTADGAVTGAVDAMKLGALDYLVKPFELPELSLVIERARRARQSARIDEHRRTAEKHKGFYFGNALAGLEQQLEKILAADRRIETRLPPVLIEGETGTGKTTIARWIHNNGPRAGHPLVEINCSALPEALAESELFGHERGAFTDARSGRIGLFEAAHGGTLFLDELPSLSPGLQAKLLTVLEDGLIRRVGGNKAIPVDVRVIAAANRDLKAEVSEGRFREDLFHRLDLFRIVLPPIRNRREDLLPLAQRLIEQLCQRHRLPQRTITPLGEQRLRSYSWPGNVRELAHELERAIVFEDSAELNFEHLTSARGDAPPVANQYEEGWFNPAFVFPPEGFSLEEAIQRVIDHALKQSKNNVSAAARLLGVTRDYVRYRLAGQKKEEEKAG
jgi:two-component system, NtrC family, response regulator AtoC